MDLKALKRQHEEILKLVKAIESELEKEKLINNAFAVSLKLGELSGKLLFHLNSEDQYLYPSLLNNGTAAVKKIAQTFMQEMGNITQEFNNYKAKYLSATKIKENPEEFITKTRDIFKVLTKRIEKEEKELYPKL